MVYVVSVGFDISLHSNVRLGIGTKVTSHTLFSDRFGDIKEGVRFSKPN